jgi:hypothetical protein
MRGEKVIKVVKVAMFAGLVVFGGYVLAVFSRQFNRPLIQITGLTEYAAVDGQRAWEIKYAINGTPRFEFFSSPERRDEYVEYLRLVGTVRE